MLILQRSAIQLLGCYRRHLNGYRCASDEIPGAKQELPASRLHWPVQKSGSLIVRFEVKPAQRPAVGLPFYQFREFRIGSLTTHEELSR